MVHFLLLFAIAGKSPAGRQSRTYCLHYVGRSAGCIGTLLFTSFCNILLVDAYSPDYGGRRCHSTPIHL